MTASPFPFDPVLTGITLSYPQRRMIADQVLPRLPPIMAEKFKYFEWNREEGFTIPDTKVGRKSEPTQVEFTAAQKNGVTQDYALDDFLPHKDIANAEAEGLRPRDRAVNGLTQLILTAREKRVADLVFDPAQYAAANKILLAGVTQWSAKATSTPIADILTGADAAFVRPNTLTIGRLAWTALISHPDIATATGAATKSAGIVRMEQIAELFELDQINVGESWINTAKKGQAPVYQRLWGNNALLSWLDPNVQSSEDNFVTFGFTQQRALINGIDRVAGSLPDQKRGIEGGEIIRVGEASDEIIAAPDVAYFIEAAA